MRLEAHFPVSLRKVFALLLAESPDPDGALNLLERFARAAPSPVVSELAQRPAAATYLVAAFGFGGMLAEAFLAETALASAFARDRQFAALKSREDLEEELARFSAADLPADLPLRLLRFKRRNTARIALKDVLGLATLAESTLELSSLADVILAEALRQSDRELERRYGQPQDRDAQGRLVRTGFSIISLGKLGGSELNYSSDIDLLFLYSRDGETAGGDRAGSSVSNKEYFVRLAQAVVARLTEMTPEGQAFRVDLRLRPEGDQGDLTLSLGAALDYYSGRAQDWELQMLIKARHSAGDARLTRAFLRGVESRVYSPPGDLAAVESVMLSRERISRRVRESRHESIDVKRQAGGIRDIEFLTQCLQRLYGRREPWVRSGGTLHALRKLNDKALLSDRDYATLTSAYEFLRKLEHRIQLESGQQSHRLPSDPVALERLARRMEVGAGRERPAARRLLLNVSHALGEVERIHQRLLRAGDVPGPPGVFQLKAESASTEPGLLSHSSLARLLASCAPEYGRFLSAAGGSRRMSPRLARFAASLAASPPALSLARESPAALARGLEVLRISEPLGEFLIHHPEDLAVLTEPKPESVSSDQLSMPLATEDRGPELRARPAAPYAWAAEPGLDARTKMSLLRRSFRAGGLELGAHDCVKGGGVYESLRRWSDLAASCVATAFAMSREMSGATAGSPRMAVLGLGRLGLSEFDLGSDADLIFIVEPHSALEDLSVAVRCGEKMIEVLSSYTVEGAVFAVDARLRPRGAEGELVLSQDALVDYVVKQARPWEALSYLKACPVAGDRELGVSATEELVRAVLDRFTGGPQLAAALRDMRRRLEREPRAGHLSTKSAPGGYYDVDFAVSYQRLRHRLYLPPGSNMLEQIAALSAADSLAESDLRALAEGAVFLRALDHAMRLVTGKRVRGLPQRAGPAHAVEELMRLWSGPPNAGPDQPIQAKLAQVQRRVREVYHRVLGA